MATLGLSYGWQKFRAGYLNEVLLKPWFNKSSDLQISSLVRRYFKKINAFLLYMLSENSPIFRKI